MLNNLKEKLYSDNWDESLEAAIELAKNKNILNINILLDAIKSENHSFRNAAILGLRDFPNQKILKDIIYRIEELGVTEDIGTMVYGLEPFDCSRFLYEIIKLNITGDFEVRNATTNILNDQIFKIKLEELSNIEKYLFKHGFTIDSFQIKYELLK